jgi:NAD(P)-dependent dehydrogenase (short-subunit alcohol dehydrogenase family)
MTDAIPAQQQDHPGGESDMTPMADHGEQSYEGHGRLRGKRALITGGDSGIGRAVALAFAREGADVAFSHLDAEREDAAVTTGLIKDAGRTALALAADLSDRETCHAVVAQATDGLGGLDVLVSNAAFQMMHQGIADLPPDELEHTFSTNVFAFVHLVQAALPHLEAGASIIASTSIQAYQPNPGLLAYAATKGAIVNLVKSMAAELTPQGIRVNAVAPGPVWTPLIPATMPEDKVEGFGSDEAPLGRAAQPAELAPAYVLLASDEASFISGEILGVTGGTPLS